MKVVHLSPTFYHPESAIGGGERYVSELARAQAALGMDVTLVSFGDFEDQYTEDGVNFEIFRRKPKNRDEPMRAFSLKALDATKRADLVHVHQIHTPLTARVIGLMNVRGTPVVATDHNGGAPLNRIERRLISRANHYAFVSRLSAERFPWAEESLCNIIHGGVDTDRFAPGRETAHDYVLFAGRPLPVKGLDLLLETVPPGIKLILALGSAAGVAREEVDRKAAAFGNRVSTIWDAPADRLLELYRNARMLVLPSTSLEVFGLVALEALACGTPVIVTDTCGVSEVLGETPAACVVRAGNADDLRKALVRVWESNSRELRTAARRTAQANSWRVVAGRLVPVYEALTARSTA